MFHEQLTIWIPTKNRPDFLSRLLNYYSATKFRGFLFIGDSSEGEYLEKNKETIQNLSSSLNIHYCELPGLSAGHVSSRLVPQIETEYSTFCADDDIITTTSIEPCIRYLNDHEDYVGANGKAILFGVESGDAFGDISACINYKLAPIINTTGLTRLKSWFSNLRNTNMCFHRTSNQIDIFKKVAHLSKLHSNYNFEELIHGVTMCIRGKIIELPNLFLCMQMHPNQFYGSGDMYGWFTDKDWYSAYSLLERTVIQELYNEGGITENEALESFKEMFWPYYANALTKGWNSYQNKNLKSQSKISLSKKRFRGWVKEIPHAKAIVKKIRSSRLHFANNDELSLPALLNPSSPYHKDFMPVYNVITNN